jgi:hypothetical protein
VMVPPATIQKQFYSYESFLSSSVSTLQPGDQVMITWTAHPDSANQSSTEAALKLEVLLVPESAFHSQTSCDKTAGAVIDQITTTNTEGRSSIRRVSIPPDMQPGQYELVRMIWSLTGSVCFGTTVTVVPAQILPRVPVHPMTLAKL